MKLGLILFEFEEFAKPSSTGFISFPFESSTLKVYLLPISTVPEDSRHLALPFQIRGQRETTQHLVLNVQMLEPNQP